MDRITVPAPIFAAVIAALKQAAPNLIADAPTDLVVLPFTRSPLTVEPKIDGYTGVLLTAGS